MIASAENFDQLPPHDIDAERCALASMALCGDDRTTFAKIRRQLWKQAFFLADHQIVFAAMCDMADAGRAIDLVLLRKELLNRGLLEEIGGVQFLAEMVNSVPSPAHGPHYASAVAMEARKRDAIGVANSLVKRLLQPIEDGDTPAAIQDAIAKLWQTATIGRDLKIWKLAEALYRFVEIRVKGERKIALDTGIAEIDNAYRGVLTLGGYTLIAARPSMGKSTLVRSMLTNLARMGTPVGLIAVEENEDKIAGNILSSTTEIENSRLAYGKWSGDITDRIDEAYNALKGAPFYGIDSAFSLVDILTAAELLATQHGCKIVAIDHIHLIDHKGRAENRNQQLSEISSQLKALFKRLGVAGVVAAQLNRPSKEVEPPPPHLTDLRDSGSLEEHADAVLMIHRKDYYHRGQDGYSPDGMAKIFIRKNRNGCVGEIEMVADLEHQRFISPQAEDPFATERI